MTSYSRLVRLYLGAISLGFRDIEDINFWPQWRFGYTAGGHTATLMTSGFDFQHGVFH